MWSNPLFPADLATFTEKILNEKVYFLSSISKRFNMLPTMFEKIKLGNINNKYLTN